MRGAQRAAFQEMSFEIAAQGWLEGGIREMCAPKKVSDVPTQQHHDRVALGGNKSEHEHILAAAVVALGGSLPERALCVQDDFFMLCTHEVVHDVRRRRVAARVAEPFRTDEAFHDRSRRVDAAVAIEKNCKRL